MYYTDREVKEILEQVYAEAYDQGIDDTLDYIDENYELESDDSFDLMDEYESLQEMDQNIKEWYAKRMIKRNIDTFANNEKPPSKLERKHTARHAAAVDLAKKYAEKYEKTKSDIHKKHLDNSLLKAKNNILFSEIVRKAENGNKKAKDAVAKVYKGKKIPSD